MEGQLERAQRHTAPELVLGVQHTGTVALCRPEELRVGGVALLRAPEVGARGVALALRTFSTTAATTNPPTNRSNVQP